MTPEDDVRRLLAELAERDVADPPPMPADVAARLEETLAGLSAAPGTQHEPATVVPLRRRVRPALAAAAAVVVVAGGGAAVAASLLDGGPEEQSAGFEAGGSAAETESSPAQGQDELAPPPSPTSESTGELRSLSDRGDALRLGRGDLAGQVERLVASGRLALDVAGMDAEGGRCVVPTAVDGTQRLVRFDTELATLVVGPAEGRTRAVQVLSCDGAEVVDETQVRADLAPR